MFRFASVAAVFGFSSWHELSFRNTLILFSAIWALGQISHFVLSYKVAGTGINRVVNAEQ
jgi:hypothetical protein